MWYFVGIFPSFSLTAIYRKVKTIFPYLRHNKVMLRHRILKLRQLNFEFEKKKHCKHHHHYLNKLIMSLLLNLSSSFLVELLGSWCDVSAVGRLDTAYTSIMDRPVLNRLFQYPLFSMD